MHKDIVNIIDDIKIYADNEKYDNISWKLNEISMGIERASERLNIQGG
jgi:hypothetical protein